MHRRQHKMCWKKEIFLQFSEVNGSSFREVLLSTPVSMHEDSLQSILIVILFVIGLSCPA